jgi:ubiquinone/menaquinone biosynthesis C-methylase UbiE
MQIVGIDIAEPYVAFATTRSTDRRLSFLTGDAVALDLPVGSFDRCYSLLALNFMSDPARALAGMRRVARPSGVVAAAVWDFAGGLVYQRIFWDTAAALDPEAELARGRHFSSPLTREGELAAAFDVAGLHEVAPASLTIRMEYSEFSDYWEPIANAQGPVGDYVKRLPPDRLETLAAAVRRAYLAGKPDGPRSMAATAWAARGLVP